MSFLSQPITLQSLFGKDRKIGEITVNVILNESTTDKLSITQQPVQQGASISDHAYMEPTAFSMTMLLKDNSLLGELAALNPFGGGTSGGLSKLYEQLRNLQISRAPFDITTPKRVYRNMLLGTLTQTTDRATENCLAITATFQEVIIVSVATTTAPRNRQRFAADTGATQNAGKKSALFSLNEGVGALLR